MIAERVSQAASGTGAEVPGPHDVLMIPSAARVAAIEERAVALCIPDQPGVMRVSRGVYEVYRAFHLPRPVGEMLTGDEARQARLLACIRQLAARGYLVPPEVGIGRLKGEPAPEAEPGGGQRSGLRRW
jgi:hypothetical protein